MLRECHERAVEDAFAYLEREACRARRGKNGALIINGNGFVAAAFSHRSSRAGDPLLHTHVVVANRTQGADGRWTALDGRPLFAHAKTAGYLYQARLRYEVTQRLGARWGEVHKGSADLAGFPRELIDHFSRRRAEILKQLELHGSHSLIAGNTAALETRKGKDYGVPMQRLREQWRARAEEHGMSQQKVELLLTPNWRERTPPGEIDIDDLTRQASTFRRLDVLQAVCEAHREGAAGVIDLEAKTEEILGGPEIVRISDPAATRYTTQAQIELERGLLDNARDRREHDIAIAEPELTEAAIRSRGLSDEQGQAVRGLTSSGHGIEVLRAPAGAGKTFTLDAARHAWESSGTPVIGCVVGAGRARTTRAGRHRHDDDRKVESHARQRP